MEGFMNFIQSFTGRWIRIIVGAVLIVIGLVFMQGLWGSIVAVIGLLPLFAGFARVCLIAPLFGYTFDGQKRTGAMGL